MDNLKTPVDLNGKTILITGGAGFIGSHLAVRLINELNDGRIITLDNMDDYYDKELKWRRLEQVKKAADKKLFPHLFIYGSISDKKFVDEVFMRNHIDVVVNLAGQAGVRGGCDPDKYIESNIVGFYNILEACRHYTVKHLVYASSSSVYGGNTKIPFSTDDKVDCPVSLYAATKKSNELFAHAYSKLYDIPSTGLRFFTVYGPAGRPDMFYYSTTEKLCAGEIIRLFNYGNMVRDFTDIDDIVEGIVRVMKKAPAKRTGEDGVPIPPYCIYNIGGGKPENLLKFVTVLQEELVRAGLLPEDYDFESHREFVEMQPGDVPITYADPTEFEKDFEFRPTIGIRYGLRKFAEWYRDYHNKQLDPLP